MKRIHLTLLLAVLMSMVASPVCALKGEKSKDARKAEKRIAKIVVEDNEGISYMYYNYDSLGRVSQVLDVRYVYGTETDSYFGFSISTKDSIKDVRSKRTYYTYGNDFIVAKNDEETHLYTLKDGLIVKEENTISDSIKTERMFAYDESGYLIKITEMDEEGEFSLDSHCLKWDKGNLVSDNKDDNYYDGYYEGCDWTYSSKKMPKGMFDFFHDDNLMGDNLFLDEVLKSIGVFGRVSKNLPSVCWWYENLETFGYTQEKGLITKIVKKFYGEAIEGFSFVYTITWEDIPR